MFPTVMFAAVMFDGSHWFHGEAIAARNLPTHYTYTFTVLPGRADPAWGTIEAL